MFNVLAKPTFTRTVKVKFPSGDGVETASFKATFLWVPSDELETFDRDTTEGIKEMLRHVLVSASEIVDDDGKELPWDDELREQVLGWSNARVGLLLAYNSGWIEEKRGN